MNPPYDFQTSTFIQRPFLQQTTSTAQQQPLSTFPIFQETFPSQYSKYVSNVHHNNYTTADTSSTSSNSQNSSLDVESSQSSNLNLVSFINDYTSQDA